jgi:hypothetical protein
MIAKMKRHVATAPLFLVLAGDFLVCRFLSVRAATITQPPGSNDIILIQIRNPMRRNRFE